MARARRFLVHLVIRRRWLVIALSIGAASVLTPRAGTAQQLERLTIGVRRSASANAVPLVLQDAPRATPTRHVVTGAIIGGLVGVVVRRSTADCDAEALSGLCRDSATLGGLTIGAATGAVIGLVIWVARNPRPTTAP